MDVFIDFNERIYRYCLIKNGVLYCADGIYKEAAKWTGTQWVECPFEETEDGESITFDQAGEMVATPPWDVFKAIKQRKADECKAYWEAQIASTPKRVIGYTNTAYGTDGFLPAYAGDDLKDEEYAAIIRDFRQHKYFFTGEDYQESCYPGSPVLENYRFVDFSRRGFGGLMAKVRGDYSAMGYCNYTEAIFFDDKQKRYPEDGLYPDVERGANLYDIDKATFDAFVGAKEEDRVVPIVVPEGEKGYYWPGDALTLLYQKEVLTVQVVSVMRFKEKDEYDAFFEWREMNCSPWQDAYASHTVLLVKELF